MGALSYDFRVTGEPKVRMDIGFLLGAAFVWAGLSTMF
jgi:hypothetical protein